jgi:hypothetical protein
MKLIEIYALVTGGILVVVLSIRLAAAICNVLPWNFRTVYRIFVLRYCIHRHRHVQPVTYANMLCILGVVTSLIFLNVFAIHDLQSASRRAAIIAIVNMPFLFLASQLPFAADIVGISIDTYHRLHRWLSVIIFVEVSLHIAFIIVKTRLADVGASTVLVYGILVSASKWRVDLH